MQYHSSPNRFRTSETFIHRTLIQSPIALYRREIARDPAGPSTGSYKFIGTPEM